MFFHIPTLRHDTYFLNGKSQQNQTCVATTGFPSSVYTTVLFEENAYDFFFRGGGGGGGGQTRSIMGDMQTANYTLKF